MTAPEAQSQLGVNGGRGWTSAGCAGGGLALASTEPCGLSQPWEWSGCSGSFTGWVSDEGRVPTVLGTAFQTLCIYYFV